MSEAPLFCWNRLKVTIGEKRLLPLGHVLDVERLALHASLGKISVQYETVSFEKARSYMPTIAAYREPAEGFWEDSILSPLMVLELPDGKRVLVDGLKRLKLAERLLAKKASERVPRIGVVRWQDALPFIPTAQEGMDPLEVVGLKTLSSIDTSPLHLDAGKVDHVGPNAIDFDLSPNAPSHSEDYQHVQRELISFILQLHEAKKVKAQRNGTRYTEHDRADDAEKILAEAPKSLVAGNEAKWVATPILSWDHTRKNLINKDFYQSLGFVDGEAFRRRWKSEFEASTEEYLDSLIAHRERFAIAFAKTISRIGTALSWAKSMRQVEEGKDSLKSVKKLQERWIQHPAYLETEVDLQDALWVAAFTGVHLWSYFPRLSPMADALAFSAWLNRAASPENSIEIDQSLFHAVTARLEIDRFGGDHQSSVWKDIFTLAENLGIKTDEFERQARDFFEKPAAIAVLNRSMERLAQACQQQGTGPAVNVHDHTLNGIGRSGFWTRVMRRVTGQ